MVTRSFLHNSVPETCVCVHVLMSRVFMCARLCPLVFICVDVGLRVSLWVSVFLCVYVGLHVLPFAYVC